MEKLGFGALLKTAFKRCFERRLSRLAAMQVLLTFLLMLPLVIGVLALVVLTSAGFRSPDSLRWTLGIAGAMMLYYLPCIYLTSLVAYGFCREILYPEARIGRGLKNGFARWKVAFYPIPWFFAAGFISLVTNLLDKLLVSVSGGWMIGKLLGFVVSVAVGMVSHSLMCAVAASDTGVRFGELYNRAFAAVKNGWGRYIGGLVMLWLFAVGICLVTVLPVLLRLLIFRRAFPGGRGVWIVLFAAIVCLFVYLCFRLWVFGCVYFVNLFVDASGLTRAEMGLPVETEGEAAPETAGNAGAPAAEAPAEETAEQDK